MLGKVVFACCSETAIEYEICDFHGHIFRRYPGNRLEKASKQEKELAKNWK